jgi:hypothetical protein
MTSGALLPFKLRACVAGYAARVTTARDARSPIIRCATRRVATTNCSRRENGGFDGSISDWPRSGRLAALTAVFIIYGRETMSLGTILAIILIIFLLGGFSGRFGGYGYGFGNGGVGVIGAILIVVIVLILMGRI